MAELSTSPPPLVSVCIDVFNYADFLPEAAESVLTQTLTDIEIIITDDCSTDESFAIAQKYAERDSRVRALRNPVNLGMVRNRNAGLRAARGHYVLCLHADDFLASPKTLARMSAVLEANPALSLVATAMQFVNARSEPTGVSNLWPSGTRPLAGTTVISRCLWEQKNLVGGPSAVMFRRDRAGRGFDERYFHAADLEMWLHLLEQGGFAYLPEPLTAYRWHGRQQTEKDKLTLSQADDQRALLATYLPKSYIKLRPWMKEYLRYEAVRQTRRRGRTLGQRSASEAVLDAYEPKAYLHRRTWCLLWRKVSRLKPLARPFQPPLPPAANGRREPVDAGLPLGINVCGFVKGEYGIGESSRAYSRAVGKTGLPHVFYNIDSRDHRNEDDSLGRLSRENPNCINLMTFSFDYAKRFFHDQGPEFFKGRYNIALWYWELEQFPARWHTNFDYYDEIWTPTEFCRAALAAVSPIPVHKILYPLHTVEATPDRARFGLRECACVFLFTFDYCSTLARKNPLGVVEAFRQAFSPGEDVTLVLKAINPGFDPSGNERVRQAVVGLDTQVLETHLTGTEMNTLLASCDCYVSLHRSEGLGLGMAQAMSLGRPVIGTEYSGNLEYMHPGNSLLVPYERVTLTEDAGPYETGAVWAEPDITQAAERMRWVYEHRDEAQRLGKSAQAEIRAALDPAQTAQAILSRIGEITGTASGKLTAIRG